MVVLDQQVRRVRALVLGANRANGVAQITATYRQSTRFFGMHDARLPVLDLEAVDDDVLANVDAHERRVGECGDAR